MRCRQMLVHLAILVHCKRPAAYSTLRTTGATTLRNYTNVIHHKTTFNSEVLQELEKVSSRLEEHQRRVGSSNGYKV